MLSNLGGLFGLALGDLGDLGGISKVLREDEALAVGYRLFPEKFHDGLPGLINDIYSKYRFVAGDATGTKPVETALTFDMSGVNGWVFKHMGTKVAPVFGDRRGFEAAMRTIVPNGYAIVLAEDAVTDTTGGATPTVLPKTDEPFQRSPLSDRFMQDMRKPDPAGAAPTPPYTPKPKTSNSIYDFAQAIGAGLSEQAKQKTTERIAQIDQRLRMRQELNQRDRALAEQYRNYISQRQNTSGSNLPIVLGVLAVLGVGAAFLFYRKK